MSPATTAAKLTQADRRARTRSALLEAAARGLSRYGYSKLVLEQVASEAGYSRGALYHLFANKEELALAVVEWVEETWWDELGPLMRGDDDPVDALVAVVRGHAIYCRREVARVMMTLRVEFGTDDHPVGLAVHRAVERVIAECTKVIAAGQESGSIPATAPPRLLAIGVISAVEGLVISLSGKEPYDEDLSERVVLGILGLPPARHE